MNRSTILALAVQGAGRSNFAIALMVAATLAAGASRAEADYTFTTFDIPGAHDTWVMGISGNTLVGYNTNNTGWSGFSSTGGVNTKLDYPGTAGNTIAHGVTGGTVVGVSNGFAWSETGGVYTTLTFPGAAKTLPNGIYGSTIVGQYETTSVSPWQSFSESGGVYTPINIPGAYTTAANGISGDTIVGTYSYYNPPSHGFALTNGVLTTLDDPAAVGGGGTVVTGIDGNNIVGWYDVYPAPAHGFIETGGVYTTLDHPLAWVDASGGTYATGISGNTIVGYYVDSSNARHGFTATLTPEPTSLALLALGGGVLLMRRRRSVL